MKVGVNTLIRSDTRKLYYVTNSETWIFCYDRDDKLMVRFRQNESKKAENDTRVVIKCLTLDEIQLDRFLFLRKPSGTTLSAISSSSSASTNDESREPEGYILLDGPFQCTIFIGGIFIRKEKEKSPNAPSSGFHYGYSLLPGIPINRDRTLVDDEETLAEHTFDLWKRVFTSSSPSESSQALHLYMALFEDQKLCQDILYAQDNLTEHPDIAKLQFKELKTMHGLDCWFYEIASTQRRMNVLSVVRFQRNQSEFLVSYGKFFSI
ncbi:hypothetical protein D9757_005224 [Collybiopsis confluens]|uniref:Uncharacterized protein n=1 Tax=Collybiopsis confluens TaxID=2823264 RepID=A0A8H5HVW7_9AGAR|nr:hypothetical protein D9757_005224 [Collybiopsis confluens]